MAATAFRTIYIEEWINALEERESWLRKTVTTKAQIKGNSAVFLVAGSGSATAVTRGADGLIPARNDDLTQNTCVIAEWHDLPRKTGFTVDMSQGDQRQIMQLNSMGVMNRKIDADIITPRLHCQQPTLRKLFAGVKVTFDQQGTSEAVTVQYRLNDASAAGVLGDIVGVLLIHLFEQAF